MYCRFEDDKHISGLFEELWEENTSGDNITLQLYLGEIVSLITDSFMSSSWTSKRKVSPLRFQHCASMSQSLSLVVYVICFNFISITLFLKRLPRQLLSLVKHCGSPCLLTVNLSSAAEFIAEGDSWSTLGSEFVSS